MLVEFEVCVVAERSGNAPIRHQTRLARHLLQVDSRRAVGCGRNQRGSQITRMRMRLAAPLTGGENRLDARNCSAEILGVRRELQYARGCDGCTWIALP